jgi:uncharacterized protein YecE (DUF72 family)
MEGEEITPKYFFGTAGWSYKDWEGTVYPSQKPADFNPLAFLSQTFEFVEVNTTFYHIPSINLTTGWGKKTEALGNFNFWIKIYQNFTHKKTLLDDEVKRFNYCLEPLASTGKLAGLLAQFPYSFKFNQPNLNYIIKLGKTFSNYSLAVEFRHNSWNQKAVLDAFRDNELIWVNLDQPVISMSLPATAIVTHPHLSYFRLHGRNHHTWFSNQGRDARYNYDYNTLELNQIAEKVKKISEMAKKIYISGNNHYKGQAVKNLKELKKILTSN